MITTLVGALGSYAVGFLAKLLVDLFGEWLAQTKRDNSNKELGRKEANEEQMAENEKRARAAQERRDATTSGDFHSSIDKL